MNIVSGQTGLALITNDIKIGPITIHMYGLMIVIGFLSALWLCLLRADKKNLDKNHIWNMFFCAMFGGMLGAKILYWIVSLPEIIKDPSILLDVKNGFVVYGGIIGGILTCFVYAKIKKIVFADYFDLIMPTVSLAQCFGRIGCLCAGCCYGRETDAWYGIVFHNSSFAPNGVKLIPTQIISAGADLLLCFILLYYESRKPKRGCVAGAWLVMYGIGRFALEFLRNDYRGNLGVLSTSQAVSIGIVSVGVILWIFSSKRKSVEMANETANETETEDSDEEIEK